MTYNPQLDTFICVVEAGSSKIRISSLRSGLKVISVDLAGILRYRESVC